MKTLILNVHTKTKQMTATLLALVFNEIDATSYTSLSSTDGFTKLQWTYNRLQTKI